MIQAEDPDDFLVVLHTGRDREVTGGLGFLASKFPDLTKRFATVSVSENSGQWIDPMAHLVGGDDAVNRRLIDYLANELEDVQTLRLLTVTASQLDPKSLDELNQFRQQLQNVIKDMAAHVEIFDYRVSIPAYGESPPADNFFSQAANANVIVMPIDSLSHTAIARPVERGNSEVRCAHIAIEVATLGAVWKEMTTPVVDQIPRFFPGVDDVIVHFVTGRAAYLICPPLPIDRLLSDEGELPFPHGFYPTPDPRQAAERLGALIFPDELRYVPLATIDAYEEIESQTARSRYLSEFLRALIRVPRVLFRGVQDHLEELAGSALQEAVGGGESSLRVVYPGRDEAGRPVTISEKSIQHKIDEISERLDRPVLTTIGEGLWIELVDKVIAVCDGGSAGKQIRAQYADEKYLLVNQAVLSPPVDDFSELVKGIYVEARRVEAEIPDVVKSSSDADTLARDVAPEDQENAFHDVDSVDEGPDTAESYDATDINDQNHSSTGTSQYSEYSQSESEFEDESAEAGHHDLTGDVNTLSEPVATNLLREIARQLGLEQERARRSATAMIERLLSLPHEFSPHDARTISRSVRVSVALGLSVIYFALGTLTARRNLLNFEFLGSSNRELLWTLVTTVVIGLALLGLFLSSISKTQGRVIMAATLLVSVIGLEVIFWRPIRDKVLTLDVLRRSAVLGAIIMFVALFVVAASIARNSASENRFRRLFSITLGSITWIYVVVGITAELGSDSSAFRDLENPTSRRLLFGLLLLGITLIVAASLVVAYTVVQEKFRLNRLAVELNWAAAELTQSADAEKRLRLASVQWLGTAAVLARLFKYPLGSDFAQISSTPESVTSIEEILKFDQRPLVLTKRGEQGLAARLRQLFIGQGWLGRQYRQLILRFQDDLAFSQGLDVSKTKGERPESCSALPTKEEVDNDRARGPRWWFLKNVLSGEYDSALLDTASEVQLEDAYSTVVVDGESHSVGDSADVASDYFGRLIPARKLQIPSQVVGVLFGGNDERQNLVPHVWWPEELMGRPDSLDSGIKYHPAPVLTPSRINDPIRLFGACVLVSHPFRLQDVLDARASTSAAGEISIDISEQEGTGV